MNERERLAVTALLGGMQGMLNVLTGALEEKSLNHGEHGESTEGGEEKNSGQDNGKGEAG